MTLENRPTSTSRDVRAGCFTCNGVEPLWFGGQVQGTAARHHDATGHPTWCDVYLSVRYGAAVADADGGWRQVDIEDAIASASATATASSGGEPNAAPPSPIPTRRLRGQST